MAKGSKTPAKKKRKSHAKHGSLQAELLPDDRFSAAAWAKDDIEEEGNEDIEGDECAEQMEKEGEGAVEEDAEDVVSKDNDQKSKRGRKKRKLEVDPESLTEFNAKMSRRGVIYISKIPPYMQPLKIRHYFEQFGEVDRVYLTPEDNKVYEKRKRMGGNKRKKFVDGWVEFLEKKEAKQVAAQLNGETIGGPKGNYWRDDTWLIKYLPKFKWHHLAEGIAYENRVREEKLRAEIAQSKRENNSYLDAVSKAEQMEKMKARKQAEGFDTAKHDEERDQKAAGALQSHLRTNPRRFKQKKTKQMKDVKGIDDVLGTVF